MGPNERVFKKEYAKELLKIAFDDLQTAQVLAQSNKVRKENILFHVEQAVEKSLKAVLCYRQQPVPFTHDLYAVLQKFPDNDLPPGGFAISDLTPFATIRRYEEGTYDLTVQDISNSIEMAQNILSWSKKQIEK